MIVCVLLGPLCWFSTQCTRIFFQKKQKQHKLLIKIITIIQRIRKATLTEWKRCRMSKGDSKTQIAHMNIHERNVLCFFRILQTLFNDYKLSFARSLALSLSSLFGSCFQFCRLQELEYLHRKYTRASAIICRAQRYA